MNEITQEEIYESLFAIAWQLKNLDEPWALVQQAFLDAHNHRSRAPCAALS